MRLLQLAALLLFLAAGLAAFGWFTEQDAMRALGLTAFGLACYVAAGFVPGAAAASR